MVESGHEASERQAFREASHCTDFLVPQVLNAEVKDLQDRVRLSVSSGLQCACMHWPKELSRMSHESDELHAMLGAFVAKRLMYWLEVLSLIGALRVVEKIALVERWLSKVSPEVNIGI